MSNKKNTQTQHRPSAAKPIGPKVPNKAELRKKEQRKQMITKIVISVVIVAVLVAIIAVVSGKKNNESAANGEYKVTHYADIVVKDYGTITLELYGDLAPITVENFVNLAESGFYDGLTFHRIMAGFMMQGGDPDHNGTGGSDTEIKGEFAANGVENTLSHTRGVVSMARSNDPNSASSQFFIMHQDYTGLDGSYAAFGRVISGMEVVDAVCTDAQPTDNNGTIPFEEQPVMESVTIRAN